MKWDPVHGRAFSAMSLFTKSRGFPNAEVLDSPHLLSKAVDELILKPFSPRTAEAEQRAGLEASFRNDKIHLAIN